MPQPPDSTTTAAVTLRGVRKSYGEVDAAFRSAHAIVEATLSIGRHSGVPLETRGAIARYDAARDVLELHGAAKVPHWNRDQIARMLGRGASSVHLFEGHVGGGFGIRGEIYPEDVLVCVAALRMQRPIKWIEDRREHLIAAIGPIPRTSPITGWRSAMPWRRAMISSPKAVAWARNASLAIALMLSTAAAQATGLPP